MKFVERALLVLDVIEHQRADDAVELPLFGEFEGAAEPRPVELGPVADRLASVVEHRLADVDAVSPGCGRRPSA